jgi:hypothetical protein
MLIHHDPTKSYSDAALAAGAHARSKLEQLIDQGRARARQVFETVQAEQPVDRLVRRSALRFVAGSEADAASADILLQLGRGDDRLQRLHPHALQQAASRAGIPWAYVQHLREQPGWGTELAAHNLTALFRRAVDKSEERILVRSVQGEVRGLLSDRFKRLDSRPLLDSFAKACSDVGALPLEGHASDVRVAVKAVLPRVYEPVEHEVMAFGVSFENSDFGAGALSVRIFTVRLVCTNYAVANESLREVHLGARLPEEVAWSERTTSLEAKRTASAIGDIVRGQLSSKRIDAFQDAIRQANQQKVHQRDALQLLRKTLTQNETKLAVEKFNSPDIELLPPGNTTWRLSNAISWLAGTTDDVDRKLELERFAGRLLPKAA